MQSPRLRPAFISVAALTILLAAGSAEAARVTGITSLANPIFFSAPTYPSGGASAKAIAVGDLNGDRISDLVVLNNCLGTDCNHGGLGVLLGNPDSTFRPVAAVFDTGGYQPAALAVGDLNGDGKLDVVVVNSCDSTSCTASTVDVLLGNGDGTFGGATTYSPGGISSNAVKLGDFNRDGKLDVAVLNSCFGNCKHGSVGILLGNGDGTLQAATNFSSGGHSPSSFDIGDVNRYGKLDIAIANTCVSSTNCTSGGIEVLHGDGLGSFQLTSTISEGYYPIFVRLKDVNGDGLPDLIANDLCVSQSVCTASQMTVRLGKADGHFRQPKVITLPAGFQFSAAADMNNDGLTDLIADSVNGPISVMLGNGDGTYQTPLSYATGGGGIPVIADFNRDGHLDVVVTAPCGDDACSIGAVALLLGSRTGSLNAPGVFSSGGDEDNSVVAGDFNNDGIPDLAVASRCTTGASCPQSGTIGVLLGNGDATFKPVVTYPSGGEDTLGLAVADINADGNLDLLAANYCTSSTDCTTGSLAVFLGNGDGTFQGAVTFASGAPEASSIGVGDFNRDGKPDIAITHLSTGNPIGILLGNGHGSFRSAVTFPGGPYPADAIAVGDFNGDGVSDLAIANNSSDSKPGVVSVMLGNGNGTFRLAVGYSSGGSETQSIVAADVNADGKLDLVAGHGSSVVGVLLGNGDGTFQAAVGYPANGEVFGLAVADINQDGQPDIGTAAISFPSSVGVLFSNGSGTFQDPSNTYLGGGYSIVLTDLNGDGYPDAAVATGNGVLVLRNVLAAP